MAAQPSLTRIVNRAAVRLGSARQISSIDEQSPLATAARAVLDDVRDELLASHPWNFAVRRALCAEVPDVGNAEYKRGFEKPADCLRWLPNRPDVDPYADIVIEEDGVLLSNASAPLAIRYIARIEDPSKWSPGFNAAMAAQIALEVSPILTGEDGLSRKLQVSLERTIAQAKREDGLASGQRARTTPALSRWVAARDIGMREGQYGPPIV